MPSTAPNNTHEGSRVVNANEGSRVVDSEPYQEPPGESEEELLEKLQAEREKLRRIYETQIAQVLNYVDFVSLSRISL